MSDRIVIDVDRDGWTKELQLNIAKINENDRGMGYRLAGPKYNGSSTTLLRADLDDRDVAEIRALLDAAHPLPPVEPSRAEVLAEAEAYPGELSMLRGVLGVIRVVAQQGDTAELRRIVAEHRADERDAYAEAEAMAAAKQLAAGEDADRTVRDLRPGADTARRQIADRDNGGAL